MDKPNDGHGKSTLVVRRLDPSQWQILRELRLASLQDSPAAFSSTYADEHNRQEQDWRTTFTKTAWFGTWCDGQPVALAAGDESWDNVLTERDLNAMWIKPTYRGQSITPLLIEAVQQWAHQEGAKALALWVTDGTNRACTIYEKYGFTYVRSAPLERDTSVTAQKYTLSIPQQVS